MFLDRNSEWISLVILIRIFDLLLILPIWTIFWAQFCRFLFCCFFFLFCHFHEYISCDIEKRKQKEEMLFSACLVLFHYRFFLWSRKTHTYTIIWNREKLYRNETKYALILNSLILKIDGKLIFSICLTYGFQYFQKKRIKKKSNVNICRWFSFETEIHIKIAR